MFTNRENFFKTCIDKRVLACSFSILVDKKDENLSRAIKEFGRDLVNETLFGDRTEFYNLEISTFDENGNIDCMDCVECYGCFKCRECVNCKFCSYCRRCVKCLNCKKCTVCRDCDSCNACDGCTRCIRVSQSDWCKECKDCTSCIYCEGCKDCSGCSGCKDCSNCDGCKGCKQCTRCSGCKWSSECSDCVNCTWCSECKECKGCDQCINFWSCIDTTDFPCTKENYNLVSELNINVDYSRVFPSIIDKAFLENIVKPSPLELPTLEQFLYILQDFNNLPLDFGPSSNIKRKRTLDDEDISSMIKRIKLE